LDERTTGKRDIAENGMNETPDEARIKPQGGGKCGQFNMRKRINSTTYEVAVYFSKASRETMDDKILRLARGEALNEDDGH
jgi:hypothetical protein